MPTDIVPAEFSNTLGQRGAGLDPTVASFPGASYPSGNHVAHATRCYAGESLKERLPDLSEPFPKGVIPEEIAVAYGRRHVYKLVDVLALPFAELDGSERARALRYLIGLLTNQETKAETVTSNAAAPLVTLLGDPNKEVRKLTCDALAALAQLADGRVSIVTVAGIAAVTNLLKDKESVVREAAVGFLVAMSASADGAAACLASDGEVVPAVVNLLKDEDTTGKAKLSGVQTLSNCTLTDAGIFASLKSSVPATVLDLLSSTDALKLLDIKMEGARALKNLCQHTYGKVQCLEGGIIQVILPLLRSRESDIRLQAAGCLMGLTLEHEAKMPVAEACKTDLVALLRDPSPFIAENALVTVQNICELPDAREIVTQIMSEKDKEFVFNPQVMTM